MRAVLEALRATRRTSRSAGVSNSWLIFFFFKQKTAYEITRWEFRRVLFRSVITIVAPVTDEVNEPVLYESARSTISGSPVNVPEETVTLSVADEPSGWWSWRITTRVYEIGRASCRERV